MARLGRMVRVLVGAVSAGVLALGAGAGGATAAGAVAEPGEVDLYLMHGGAELVPGGAVERALIVINHGSDMVGDVELYYRAPVFIDIEEQKELPAGCAMYYKNKDFHFPEIVKCTLSPLKAGARHELFLPIAISPGAPAESTHGVAIARPAKPDVDKERNIVDNITRTGGTISLPPIAPTSRTIAGPHVALQHTTAIVGPEASASQYRLTNLGDAAAQGIRLILVTPLFVNTSTAGALPDGCSMVLTDPDPAVPEIVECGIANLDPGYSQEISVPVKTVPGGPAGEVYGSAVLAPTSPDSPTRFYSSSYDFSDLSNGGHSGPLTSAGR